MLLRAHTYNWSEGEREMYVFHYQCQVLTTITDMLQSRCSKCDDLLFVKARILPTNQQHCTRHGSVMCRVSPARPRICWIQHQTLRGRRGVFWWVQVLSRKHTKLSSHVYCLRPSRTPLIKHIEVIWLIVRAKLNLVNDLYKNMEQGKLTAVLFLDLKKAFDMVNHNILLETIYVWGK